MIASAARARSGARAESVVADYLHARGFRLVAQNRRVGALELDIVARKDDLVVVVEVRTRGARSIESALGSISPRKRARLLEAASRLWRRELRFDPAVQRVRIDVAAVIMSSDSTSVEYIEGAIVGGDGAERGYRSSARFISSRTD